MQKKLDRVAERIRAPEGNCDERDASDNEEVKYRCRAGSLDPKKDNIEVESEKDAAQFKTEHKKRKASAYVSVSFHIHSKAWNSCIRSSKIMGKKMTNIASFTLEADAALARDIAARLLKRQDVKINFAMLQNYKRAKKCEMESKSIGNDNAASVLEIELRVKHILLKHSASRNESNLEIKAMNNVMAKNGRHI